MLLAQLHSELRRHKNQGFCSSSPGRWDFILHTKESNVPQEAFKIQFTKYPFTHAEWIRHTVDSDRKAERRDPVHFLYGQESGAQGPGTLFIRLGKRSAGIRYTFYTVRKAERRDPVHFLYGQESGTQGSGTLFIRLGKRSAGIRHCLVGKETKYKRTYPHSLYFCYATPKLLLYSLFHTTENVSSITYN